VRGRLYAAVPAVLDALADFFTALCGDTRRLDAFSLAAWCLRTTIDTCAHALVKSDLRGVRSAVLSEGSVPGSFEHELRATASDARRRYQIWGQLAIQHPGQELWAAVADRSDVSPRQAKLLYATQGSVMSLDALVAGGSRDRSADITDAGMLGDVLGISDVDDDDAERERQRRSAAASAAFRSLPLQIRLALAYPYALRPGPWFPHAHTAEDWREFLRFTGVLPAGRNPNGAVLERERVAGERLLGGLLWVLVVDAGGSGRVWRRHPALRVRRRVHMLGRAWLDARHRAELTAGVAATSDGGGEVVVPGAVEDGPASVTHGPAAEVSGPALLRALVRVGLGALGRGRYAESGDGSVRAKAVVVTVGLERGLDSPRDGFGAGAELGLSAPHEQGGQPICDALTVRVAHPATDVVGTTRFPCMLNPPSVSLPPPRSLVRRCRSYHARLCRRGGQR
jgi:hypothetical protein